MILVVEDEPDLREMIIGMLRKASYLCVEAENTTEAFAKYKMQKFKGVILDIGLPGGNGIELAKDLKNYDPGVKVICLSGYAEMLEVDLLEAKIEKVMSKPFTEKAFIKMVDQTFK